jgi:hypothetical protein
MEVMTHRKMKKDKFAELDTKYANQIAQLEADGIQIKNKRILTRLFEKADGQVDVVKQLVNERKEKHHQRKEYRHRHRGQSACNKNQEGCNETGSTWRKRREISSDDMDNLKRLRSAGVHGNPNKLLAIFHECNESMEMTIARTQEEREQRIRQRDERINVRILSKKKSNKSFSPCRNVQYYLKLKMLI